MIWQLIKSAKNMRKMDKIRHILASRNDAPWVFKNLKILKVFLMWPMALQKRSNIKTLLKTLR